MVHLEIQVEQMVVVVEELTVGMVKMVLGY
jgi:hypothetical protein